MQHFSYQTVDSTNQQALRNAVLCKGNFYVTAASQSQGRGKDARVWSSPVGNIYCSVGYRLHSDPVQATQLTFVTAVVVATWLETQLVGRSIQCKWPNDVLVEGRKIAGILLELHDELLISGIGINLSNYPTATANLPATCMSEYVDATPQPEAAAAVLAAALVDAYQRWQQLGFSEYRQQWLKRAYALGGPIVVSNYAGQAMPMRCIFQGIAEDGALLCRDYQQKLWQLYSADVSFVQQP